MNNYVYDEWGNIISQTEGIENPFKYAGEIYDSESGLYYLRSRYYDPAAGRFISEDSYEGALYNPQSLNLYAYVENNPLRYVDLTGYSKIGVLSIYSSPDSGGGGHSFIVIKNTSEGNITIGAVTIDPNQSVSIGTFGNRDGHLGVWYNIEALRPEVHTKDVSLQMDIDDEKVNKINEFIDKNDTWDLYKNCSWFASSIWNNVSDKKLSPLSWFGWNTPESLADSIMSIEGYKVGEKFDKANSAGYKDGGTYYVPPETSSGHSNRRSSGHSFSGSSGSFSSGSSGPSSSGSGYRSSSVRPRITDFLIVL